MKKLGGLFVLVILLIAVWAGATYVVGGKVESNYFGLLQQHGDYGPLKLVDKGFQRGFCTSRALMMMEITLPSESDDPDGEDEVLQVTLEHTLHNGPLPLGAGGMTPALVTIETRLADVKYSDAEVADLFQELPELQQALGLTTVGFSGATHSQVTIPAFTKQDDNATLNWGGLSASMEYQPGAGTLVGDLAMPTMSLEMDDGSATMEGVSGDFDLVEALPQLYVGATNFSLRSFKMLFKEGDQQKRLSVDDMAMVGLSRLDNSMMHVAQTFKLKSVVVDGDLYGPMVFDLEAKNLDGHALSDFQIQVQEQYRQAASFNPDEMAARVLPLYGDLLQKLVQGDPEMSIKQLYFDTPMGEADGKLRVKISGVQDMPQGMPGGLFSYLQYVDAAADVALDESLIKVVMAENMKSRMAALAELTGEPPMDEQQMEQMVEQQLQGQLDMFMAMNYIVRDGEKIKSKATFKAGELMVNGQVMPIFQ